MNYHQMPDLRLWFDSVATGSGSSDVTLKLSDDVYPLSPVTNSWELLAATSETVLILELPINEKSTVETSIMWPFWVRM